jgi:RecA/RadA recombinase
MELNQIPQSLVEMYSAFDHFNECRSTLKMTTGSAGLDSLIDSIHEGQFYLFYGNNRGILDGFALQLLVNCVLPMKEKHGFESMAIYMNNVDYYQPDKLGVLSPEKIAIAAKCAAIEPKIVFKNLFVQISYNQQHQLTVAKQVSELIESKQQDIKLLVVNNLTKFFKESKNKNYAANMLKEVLGTICRICARNKIALICTGDSNITSKGVIPRPSGGTFLKHSVNVIVHLRECSLSHPLAFKATLIKHQYAKTPKSVIVNARKTGRMLLLDRC